MNTPIILIIITLSIIIGYCISAFTKRKKVISITQPQKPNAQREDSLEKRLMLEGAIDIIEKLSETFSLSLNLNELAKEIVKTTSRILNVEICALLLLDETTDILNVIASIGIEDKLANTIHIRNGEEISGLVAKFNEIKIINNLEREVRLSNLKYDKCYKQSLVSLPLSFKNNVLGVLNISNKKSSEPFSTTDIEIIKIIALESAIAIQNLKLFQEQNKNYLNTILTLANAIDARDPYTYRHSNNVTKYAIRIAQEMRLPKQEIENIRYAGLLHDIGKIGIKDGILIKSEKLTEEEYAEIKLHPLKGEEIIKSLPFLHKVTKIIRHHHERFDGKGYPDCIMGENIELGARILALADAFDAMTTKRTYHDALILEEAKDELIKNRGTQFDPYLVDCFIQILKQEPNLVIEDEPLL